MKSRRLATLFCLAAMLLPAALSAEPDWQLVLPSDDGLDTKLVDVRAMADGQLRISNGTSDETIAVRQVARLVRRDNVTPAVNEDWSLLHLRNGDRLLGGMIALADESVTYQLSPVGPLELPIVAIDGVTPQGDSFAGEAGVQDVVTLANGDRLAGFVQSFADDRWQVIGDDGAGVFLEASAIRRVRLAGGGELAEPFEPDWLVELGNGSRLSLADVFIEAGMLRGTYFTGEVRLSLAGVQSLQPVGGRVLWLRQITPETARLTPYFGQPVTLPDLPNPNSVDASAGSFTLPSRSEVSFTVPDDATRFVASYRIEPSPQTQLADAAVRVLLDGDAVHETASVKPSDRAVAITLDVEPGQVLTLVVDYGAGLDVQDRVLWIDPLFLRPE